MYYSAIGVLRTEEEEETNERTNQQNTSVDNQLMQTALRIKADDLPTSVEERFSVSQYNLATDV